MSIHRKETLNLWLSDQKGREKGGINNRERVRLHNVEHIPRQSLNKKKEKLVPTQGGVKDKAVRLFCIFVMKIQRGGGESRYFKIHTGGRNSFETGVKKT